jgi:peroxiredoxin
LVVTDRAAWQGTDHRLSGPGGRTAELVRGRAARKALLTVSRLVFPAVLLVTVTACGEAPPPLEKGQSAPAFALDRLHQGPLAFPAELRGQVVALRFWADWCPFCESEMRDIEPVYRRYREAGLRVVAVNVRQDRATAASFIDRLEVSYDVLLDEDGSVARQYRVIGLPTTFFIDRQGRIATRILGESAPEVFEGIVRELL